MFKSILNEYIGASAILSLIKEAKITDDQYKKIYNDMQLKQKLYENDLADQFFKAMPLLSEKQIETEIQKLNQNKEEFIKDIQNEGAIINEFLSKFGNIVIGNFISRYMNHVIMEVGQEEGSIEELSPTLRYYMHAKLLNFIEDYTYITKDTNSIKQFCQLVDTLTKENNPEKKNKLIKLIGNLFFRMVNYMNSSETVKDSTKENLLEADKIRKSDTFDFLFQ